ncbi:MAG: hypothetical protein WB511_00990 [Nitrososphaeraceae archaeon]
MINFRVNLQILIVFWWIGAIAAVIAILLPVYLHFFIIGVFGWSIVILTTGLIIFEIKRTKLENKNKTS